jgi:hypothetical protein
MERVFLTRDNYYGTDTVLFNLTFRDQAEQSFTLRFAPVALIPRRRIALQKEWFDYLAKAINSPPNNLYTPGSWVAPRSVFQKLHAS